MGAPIDLSDFLWPDIAQGRQPQGEAPLANPNEWLVLSKGRRDVFPKGTTTRVTTSFIPLVPSEFVSATECTILMYGKTNTTHIVGEFGINATGAGSRCGGHLPYTNGTVYFDFGGSTEGSTRVSVAGLSFGEDVWIFTTGPRGMEIWQNGILRASNGASPTRGGISGYFWGQGAHDTANPPACDAHWYLSGISNKQLSVSRIRQISNTPWLLYKSPSLPLFVPASDGGSNLAASASGSDTAGGSANLSAAVALSSVGVALAGGSATLRASVPLSAAGIDVASGSAGLVVTVRISAAGLAQAAGAAGLSASVLLAASGAAYASGNSVLSAQLAAQAVGAAQSAGVANLSGGAPGALNAIGAAVAGGSATLYVTATIAAAGSALASGAASGTVSSPGASSASGAANASGTATLSTVVAVTAAGFVQAMGAGQFSAVIPLSAFGQAQAGGTANAAITTDADLESIPADLATIYSMLGALVTYIPALGGAHIEAMATHDIPSSDYFRGDVMATDHLLRYPSAAFPPVKKDDRFVIDGKNYAAIEPAHPILDGREHRVSLVRL